MRNAQLCIRLNYNQSQQCMANDTNLKRKNKNKGIIQIWLKWDEYYGLVVNKYPHKRRHSRRKQSQELKWKIISFLPYYTHTKMAGCKRETYKMKPRISEPFMLELEYECKIIKQNY